MATQPTPQQKGLLHEVRLEVIAGLIVSILLPVIGFVGGLIYTSTAVHDIFFHDKVDISVSLAGKANPGDVVELHPLLLRSTLNFDRQTLFEKVEFNKIKHRKLAVILENKGEFKRVVELPVGERPTINVQHEVK